MVEGKKNEKVQKENLKHAIALGYNPNEAAPRILASGRGHLAEKILEGARDHRIPVHKDEKLADTLSRLEIGDLIPPQLYEAVAEILVFLDAVDKIADKRG